MARSLPFGDYAVFLFVPHHLNFMFSSGLLKFFFVAKFLDYMVDAVPVDNGVIFPVFFCRLELGEVLGDGEGEGDVLGSSGTPGQIYFFRGVVGLGFLNFQFIFHLLFL